MASADDRVASIITALAELLCRRCVDASQPGDAESAHQMIVALADAEQPPDVVAPAAGGVWAGFRSDRLEPALVEAALHNARALLRTELSESERALVSASLTLLAKRDLGDQPAVDLVQAALSARQVEQHDVAVRAAQEALARRERLNLSQQILALLTLAVITRDRAATAEAYALVEQLPPDDLAARAAAALRPTLHPQGGLSLSLVGEAVQRGDRVRAAASLAEEIAEVRLSADDELLSGLHHALLGLAEPEIDVERARRGLMAAVGHLRRRQRFGQVPPVARAAIDIVADLLTLNTSAAAANLITELLEALADAGLSELVELADDELAPVAQARLVELAQAMPTWPDLARCVGGLRGQPALLLRRQRMLSTGQMTVLSLYVLPPDGLAIKKATLSDEQTALVDRLADGDPQELAGLSAGAIDGLVAELLPAGLTHKATSGELRSLVVVPDGPLWSVPWRAAALLRDTEVLTVPSLAIHARLRPAVAPVRRVAALIDLDAPGAELVRDALQLARADGRLDVQFIGTLPPSGATDLLLVFAHGAGSGLRFALAADGEALDALSLARAAAPTALVAACWSAAAPPVSFPINLPVAMLLGGARTVIGGLWPLPALDTARVVAATVHGLAEHGDLLAALAMARDAAPDDLLARWGLAVHGTGATDLGRP